MDKENKRALVGMNQLDLWSGGQQSNRGSKYIFQNKNTNNFKLISVVCKKIQLKSKNKTFRLFEKGFNDNTLCYLNNLQNIITDFFKLKN